MLLVLSFRCVAVMEWLCLVICIFCWVYSSWWDREELSLVDGFWIFLTFPIPSKMDTIFDVSIIHPHWLKGFCIFLASLSHDVISHDVICTWNWISFPLSHGCQVLYCKVGPQQLDFLFHTAQYKWVAISRGLTGIPLSQDDVATSWPSWAEGRGKTTAVLAASITSQTELEMKVNFVIKWYMSLVIYNVIKDGYIG